MRYVLIHSINLLWLTKKYPTLLFNINNTKIDDRESLKNEILILDDFNKDYMKKVPMLKFI